MAGMMKGDRLPELIYLELIESHCTLALEQCAKLEAAIKALREDVSDSSAFADAAFEKVLPALVGCLTHAALVSSFLFPTGSKDKKAEELKLYRCSHFRDFLSVDTPTLKKRATRNALIHMDERLDKFWSTWHGNTLSIIHSENGIRIISRERDVPVLILNEGDGTIVIFDDILVLQELTTDLSSVKKAVPTAYKSLKDKTFVPLWRKFSQHRGSDTGVS